MLIRGCSHEYSGKSPFTESSKTGPCLGHFRLSLVAYGFISNIYGLISIKRSSRDMIMRHALLHWSPLLITAGVSPTAGLLVENGLWHLILRSVLLCCSHLVLFHKTLQQLVSDFEESISIATEGPEQDDKLVSFIGVSRRARYAMLNPEGALCWRKIF